MRKSNRHIIREALRIASDYWRRNAIAAMRGSQDIDADGVIALSEYYKKEARKADKLLDSDMLSDAAHSALSEEPRRFSTYPITAEAFVAVAEKAIRHDLLAPLGLKPKKLPVLVDPTGRWFGWDGMTDYDVDSPGSPSTRIHVAPFSPGHMAASLTHELIHAAYPYGEDHGPHFSASMADVGMVAPFTSSVPGPRFIAWAEKTLAPMLSDVVIREDFWGEYLPPVDRARS